MQTGLKAMEIRCLNRFTISVPIHPKQGGAFRVKMWFMNKSSTAILKILATSTKELNSLEAFENSTNGLLHQRPASAKEIGSFDD